MFLKKKVRSMIPDRVVDLDMRRAKEAGLAILVAAPVSAAWL
jgi:hypothetical protein